MNAYVDSHCHLDFPELIGDLDHVVQRARDAGVVRMVTIGTTISDWRRTHAIALAFPDIYCSVGVHPHEADQPSEQVTADELIRLSQNQKVVAIGETGLDYFYDHAPREEQARNFREHIRAAMATSLPLVIHTRDAEDDTLRILREEMNGKPDSLRAVVHCYSSSRDLAIQAIDMGFYISLSGMLTFKKSDMIRDTVRDLLLDRLLIETDSPYLAPMPHRGKTCEPAYVVHTARILAEVKNTSVATIAAQTTDNFFTLFNRVPR